MGPRRQVRTLVLAAAGAVAVTTLVVPTEVAAAPATKPATVQVGSLILKPCDVTDGALCGSIERAWDPTGAVKGTVTVGFAFVPATAPGAATPGTLVPHEGGPGYSTTGSVDSYAQMYGVLLETNNMLLVDQRGTGLSEPIDCPALQNLRGEYAPAAAKCAKKLGDKANLYGSALAADDLAAVIKALGLGPVDAYGDSYGTFFTQVFAGRHPDLLRTITLDAAYPTFGEDAWYDTQGAAMRRSFDAVCARTPACAAAGGTTTQRLSAVLADVRAAPVTAPAYDADGVLHDVVVDVRALVYVAFNATYGPATYRELDAALRAWTSGDQTPLLRLVAENLYGDFGGVSDPVDYSEGLDAAVACHDYPQLYDMAAPPRVRPQQYASAIVAKESSDPFVYGPFTVREYLESDWATQDWCLQWPVAPAAHPAGPPVPPSGSYPDVPTLILSGELDTITTAAEGDIVESQFPDARNIVVANSFHVAALGDIDRCGVRIVREFIRTATTALPKQVTSCASKVPPVRGAAAFVASYTQMPPATPLAGSATGSNRLRAVTAAAQSAADVVNRWYNNYSAEGVGLRGGSFSYVGDRTVTFTLDDYALYGDLAVSGTVRWERYGRTVTVTLQLAGAGVDGSLQGTWDSRKAGATATLSGVLGGQPVSARVLAP